MIFAMLLCFAVPVYAAEQIDLTAPITTPSITYFKVVRLDCDWENARISVYLKSSSSSERLAFYYDGAEATALMTQMNKKNFTTTSMQKTILNKLVADGFLAGTISGSPD
jgi:hypothetical protein